MRAPRLGRDALIVVLLLALALGIVLVVATRDGSPDAPFPDDVVGVNVNDVDAFCLEPPAAGEAEDALLREACETRPGADPAITAR